MRFSVDKTLFEESLNVGFSCDDIGLSFEGVTEVYVGSRSGCGGLLSLRFCRHGAHLGSITVHDCAANELIKKFQELGVYQESKPAMQSVAC